jgi:large subunit ribosomal protein L19
MNELMRKVESAAMKKDIPFFEIGDTVDVHVSIVEGEKTRTQIFRGLVIASKGDGIRKVITVRRIVQGEGVERTFPLHSPVVQKIEVVRHGVTRRSKLYYMRERTGKSVRLRERIVVKTKEEKQAEKAEKRRRKAEAREARAARAREAEEAAQAASAEAEAPAQAPPADAPADEAVTEQPEAADQPKPAQAEGPDDKPEEGAEKASD